MSSSRHRRPSPIESLESRLLLGGDPLVVESYFPEGFVSDTINAFVPITNTNDFPVQFQLEARYEFGERDQVIATGTVPAKTRGGVTLNDILRPQDRILRTQVPFSLVLRSNAPLAAMLSHYDFGASLGESFTTERRTEWFFPAGEKDPANSQNFLLIYNPSRTEGVTVTLTARGADGQVFTDTRFIEPERRGGWATNEIPDLRNQAFTFQLSSTGLVVASQSYYNVTQGRGSALLGSSTSRDGFIASIDPDPRFYQINGRDAGQPEFQPVAIVAAYNPNPTATTITFRFYTRQDPNTGTASAITTFTRNVGARESVRLTTADTDVRNFFDSFTTMPSIGVRVSAPVGVAAAGILGKGMDGTGMAHNTNVATSWSVGEGYMSSTRAGSAVLEFVHVLNPNNRNVDVTITILDTFGESISLTRTAAANSFVAFPLHSWTTFVQRRPEQFFGLTVTATFPVLASFEHWDSGVRGGFVTAAIPGVDFFLFEDLNPNTGGPGGITG